MTAVSIPATTSRFAPAPVLDAPPAHGVSSTFHAAPVDPAPPVTDAVTPVVVPAPGVDVEGYVLFAVGTTTFAVAVSEVRGVIRAARLELLPESGREGYGRGVALVDVRGRSVPVIDLRVHRTTPGDVLLPLWRHHVGIVVDRVVSVLTPRDLVPENERVPDALPSYARGVLRPTSGGAPVLLIAMPDADELALDALRVDEPRIGEDVLGVDEVIAS